MTLLGLGRHGSKAGTAKESDMAPEPHDGDLGTVLAVFAHPDDEAYLAGGLMARAADAGRRVVCVTATRGELGFSDDDPRTLAERAARREAELRACLEVLGVTEHHWLGHPDGGCAGVDESRPVTRLCELLEDVRPDTVLTFGPDGQTYHPDHMAVSRWTTRAVRAGGGDARLLYSAMTPEWTDQLSAVVPIEQVMMTDDPPPTVSAGELALWFACDDDLVARKVQALRCQASQVEPLVTLAGIEAYTRLNRDEMFRAPVAADWPD
jgi:LmbE family N-acetylglucosaminyl deacetylase